MRVRASTVCGGLGLVCSLAVLGGVGYLTYVLPRTVEAWAEAGRELSVLQRLIVGLGSFCHTFGIFLVPLVLLFAVGSLTWLILGLTRKQ